MAFILHTINGLLHPVLNLFSSKHDVPGACPEREPPDANLFPYYLQNRQGLWLHWREWRAQHQRTRAVVFIIVGIGEHSGRYDSVALWLLRQGYACFLLDHQGHGGSEGTRNYVEKFDHYVDDQELFVRRVLANNTDLETLPKFILGHSMGGLIAIHLADRDPSFWSGVILTGPAIQADPKIATRSMVLIARLISKWVPKLPVGRIDSSDCSRNPQIVAFYNTDPQVGNVGMSARWSAEMLRAMDEVWNFTYRVTYPYLLLHGEVDRLATLAGSKRFYEATSNCACKKFVTFPDMYHEIMTEYGREDVFDEIIRFVDERIAVKTNTQQ